MADKTKPAAETAETAEQYKARKAKAAEKRKEAKSKFGDRFQSISVPQADKGYNAGIRCRACGESVTGKDPSGHTCSVSSS